MPRFGVVEAAGETGGPQVDIEVILGDVDADKAFVRDHEKLPGRNRRCVPSLVDSGLDPRVTVRAPRRKERRGFTLSDGLEGPRGIELTHRYFNYTGKIPGGTGQCV